MEEYCKTRPFSQKAGGEYRLVCPIAPSAARIDARALPTDLAMRSGYLYANAIGAPATVSGLEALPQKIQLVLSPQLGESPFHPTFEARVLEYFEPFRESAWLNDLLKLEVVRQLAIPYADPVSKSLYTPLLCVLRIFEFELLSLVPKDNRLPVRLRLEVQGVGTWGCKISIYLPTAEQMAESARRAAEWRALVAGTRP